MGGGTGGGGGAATDKSSSYSRDFLLFFFLSIVRKRREGRRGGNAHLHLIPISFSVWLRCPCCSTVDETLEKSSRGKAGRMKKEKGHWAAGRVGDIDFVGSNKMRGKVRGRKENDEGRAKAREALLNRLADVSTAFPVPQGAQQHRPGADLPDADGRLGPGTSAPGGGAGGRRRAGADEALAQGHAAEGPGEGRAEHRSEAVGDSKATKMGLAPSVGGRRCCRENADWKKKKKTPSSFGARGRKTSDLRCF